MKKRRRFTPAELAELARTMSLTDVGARAGLSRAGVSASLRRAGLLLSDLRERPIVPKLAPLPAPQRRKIKRLLRYHQAHPEVNISRLAVIFAMPASTVEAYLTGRRRASELGVPPHASTDSNPPPTHTG